MKSIAALLLVAAVMVTIVHGSRKQVIYYKSTNQATGSESASMDLEFEGCANVTAAFNDQSKSVKIIGPGNFASCVTLWENGACTGKRVQVCAGSPQAANFDLVGMGNMVSSFGWCKHGEL